MKFRCFHTAALAMAALAVSTSVAQAQPLQEELRGLIEQHPLIKASRQRVSASQETAKEAFAGYLPVVSLSGSLGWEESDKTELTLPGDRTRYPTDSASATITQGVFRGFAVQAGYESAQAGVEVADSTLEQTRQQIMFEGITAYLEVLRQVELASLAMQNQETLKKQLNLEDERVQRGSGIAVDVLQAKSRLQISRERHTAFTGALKDAVSRYTQVFGKMPDLDHMPLPGMPLQNLPGSLEEAIAIAANENPRLAITGTGMEIAKINQTSARAGYFPTVDLVADATYDDNLAGTSGLETGYSFTVQANWEVFSGFADKARIARSAHDFQAAANAHTFEARKVAEEVKLAWTSLVISKERFDLLQNAVNIAAEVFEARKRLRDAGKETALNVLDAENELFRARIDAASAKYDYYNSVYRVLQAIGRLQLGNV